MVLPAMHACFSDRPLSQSSQAVQGIYSGAISPNARYSLIGSIHHGGSLWQLDNNERLFNWNHQQQGYTDLVAVALSYDGEIALTADDRRFIFWKTKTGQAAGFWSAPDTILCAALSGDGRYALVGLRDFSALYVDIIGGQILHKLNHNGAIRSVSLSADGSLGLTGSDDRTAVLWDLNSGQQIQRWQFENSVNYVQLSPQSNYTFISSQHQRFAVWDLKNNQLLFEKTNKAATITSALFSQDESFILVGDSLQQISQWDLFSRKKIKSWRPPSKSFWKPARAKIYAIGIVDTQDRFYSISSDGVVQDWQLDQITDAGERQQDLLQHQPFTQDLIEENSSAKESRQEVTNNIPEN